MNIEPRELRVIETDRQVCIARFSPCGKLLLTGGYDAEIRRWDFSAEVPQQISPITGHRGWVQTFAFHPDGKTLISTDSWGQLCARPYADETPAPRWVQEQAHDGWIRSLAVSQDGALIATGGRDHMVRIWSAGDGKLLHELSGHEYDVYSVAIHPDGKSAVSGDLMGNLKHWDLTTGKQAREVCLEMMHFYERIQDVTGLRILQFRDNGETLLCAGSDPTKAGRAFGIPTIRLLDWKTLKPTKEIHLGPEKDGYVFDLHWHQDGYFMMVTSGPPGAGRFILLKPDEEKPFFDCTKLYNTHSLAPHPDGRRVVVIATNRQSQGNGAVLDKEGKYLGNSSPLHEFELSPAEA